MSNTSFILEAFVDFPDDALKAKQPITPAHLDAMMRELKARGVRRVSWGYYGDGHGGWFIPTFLVDKAVDAQGEWTNHADTYQLLGNPLQVAVKAAHRHGIELYAYYKPYETGVSVLFPEGSPEAQRWGRLGQIGGRMSWMDRFVVDHPDLRIKRRTDDLPADVMTRPIRTLRLVKKDDSPTRLTKERLQIWTSKLNYQYQRLDVDFQVGESVEACPRDIYDLDSRIAAYFNEDGCNVSPEEIRALDGRAVTRKGDLVRVLTLSGFEITDPYLVVTTDFADGPGDFENTGADMLLALDAEGQEIPGVFATGGAIWNADRGDFRTYGLNFDYGFGRHRLRLDEPVKIAWQGSGMIGYARGRNKYLPGALCEMEPAVREYWFSCIREMLDAGVDGIDFREENHSMHTDYPEEYGYNDVVLAECARRGTGDIAKVRGDAYTEFLREAQAMIHDAGKRMRYNLQIDWYRPDPPGSRRLAYPANLEFQWRRWIDEGLMDEAILRFFHYPFDCLYEDEIARAMIDRCRAKGVPMTVNRYLQRPTLLDEYRRIRDDGRFAGFILYETWAFMDFHADNSVTVTMKEIDTLHGE